jgi:hypothetical protein
VLFITGPAGIRVIVPATVPVSAAIAAQEPVRENHSSIQPGIPHIEGPSSHMHAADGGAAVDGTAVNSPGGGQPHAAADSTRVLQPEVGPIQAPSVQGTSGLPALNNILQSLFSPQNQFIQGQQSPSTVNGAPQTGQTAVGGSFQLPMPGPHSLPMMTPSFPAGGRLHILSANGAPLSPEMIAQFGPQGFHNPLINMGGGMPPGAQMVFQALPARAWHSPGDTPHRRMINSHICNMLREKDPSVPSAELQATANNFEINLYHAAENFHDYVNAVTLSDRVSRLFDQRANRPTHQTPGNPNGLPRPPASA